MQSVDIDDVNISPLIETSQSPSNSPNLQQDLRRYGFDAGYMMSCVMFGILGTCGTFLNGRSIYYFCLSKTVSYGVSFYTT